MKTMKQYASYRQLWQALLPYYDEREAQAVVRLTSSLRTPRNINLTIFLGKNAKNRAFLV